MQCEPSNRIISLVLRFASFSAQQTHPPAQPSNRPEWMNEPACQTCIYIRFSIHAIANTRTEIYYDIVHALLAAKVFHDDCKFSIKYMICSFRLTECNHYLDHHHHPYGNDIGLSRWHRMQMSICFSSPSFFSCISCFFFSILFVFLIVSDEYAFSSMIAEYSERDSGNERML